jgi:hypothetical protein
VTPFRLCAETIHKQKTEDLLLSSQDADAEPRWPAPVVSLTSRLIRMILKAHHATKAALAGLRSDSIRSAGSRYGYDCTARIEHLSLPEPATRGFVAAVCTGLSLLRWFRSRIGIDHLRRERRHHDGRCILRVWQQAGRVAVTTCCCQFLQKERGVLILPRGLMRSVSAEAFTTADPQYFLRVSNSFGGKISMPMLTISEKI